MINKRGQLGSLILVIVIIFGLGLMLFLLSHINLDIYNSFDTYFENSKYNNSEAHDVIDDVIQTETSIWDYVFLAIMFGYVIVLFITSFSTPISAVFYWLYGFVVLFGLVIGAMLSNVWQSFASSAELASTAARFPMTDLILGNFYPTFITVVIVTAMVLLFGKPSFNGGEQR